MWLHLLLALRANALLLLLTLGLSPFAMAQGTMTFTSDDGSWTAPGSIAADGQGGSSGIAGITLQLFACDAAYDPLTPSADDRLMWVDSAWLTSDSFGGVTVSTTGTPGIYGTGGWHGFVIRSSSSLINFSLDSVEMFDWGSWSGYQMRADAYDDGAFIGTVSFAMNTSGASVVASRSNTKLSNDFLNVDEVRIYTTEEPTLWIAVNNIQIGAPVADPTRISLATFTAQNWAGQVQLAWTTGSEVDAAGFHVWRSAAADGSYERRNSALIPAAGLSPAGASYRWTDSAVSAGETWYYKLEDLDTQGVSTLHGPISVTVGASSILSFQAVPTSLFLGGSSRLSWTVSGAPSLSINGETVTGNPLVVAPQTTTSYTLADAQGSTSLVTVSVKPFALLDMAGLAKAWGSTEGDAAYDPCYDLNLDGLVDDADVAACFNGL